MVRINTKEKHRKVKTVIKVREFIKYGSDKLKKETVKRNLISI